MANTTTFYRESNVSSAEATASLFQRFPNAELVSFETRKASAEEAFSAGAKEGDLVYVATIRTADFPPVADSDSDGDSDDDGSKSPAKGAPPFSKSDDTDSDDDSDSDSDAPAPPSDSDGDDSDSDSDKGVKPKKMKPEEEMVHLLQQILHALQANGTLGGPDLGDSDLDLPDVGAPDKGDTIPPPHDAPGGPPTKAPLPPPVKEKTPVGIGAFAHVAGKPEIHMVRADAGEVNNRQILEEAAEYAPTHRVAKLQRTGIAVVNGKQVNLAERNIAVVTLVRK